MLAAISLTLPVSMITDAYGMITDAPGASAGTGLVRTGSARMIPIEFELALVFGL